MDKNGKLGQPNPNKPITLRQVPPRENVTPLKPFVEIIYLFTTTLVAYFFVVVEHEIALNWSISLCTLIVVWLEIGPRIHRHPLIHILLGLIAAYIILVTGWIVRHHQIEAICFS